MTFANRPRTGPRTRGATPPRRRPAAIAVAFLATTLAAGGLLAQPGPPSATAAPDDAATIRLWRDADARLRAAREGMMGLHERKTELQRRAAELADRVDSDDVSPRGLLAIRSMRQVMGELDGLLDGERRTRDELARTMRELFADREALLRALESRRSELAPRGDALSPDERAELDRLDVWIGRLKAAAERGADWPGFVADLAGGAPAGGNAPEGFAARRWQRRFRDDSAGDRPGARPGDRNPDFPSGDFPPGDFPAGDAPGPEGFPDDRGTAPRGGSDRASSPRGPAPAGSFPGEIFALERRLARLENDYRKAAAAMRRMEDDIMETRRMLEELTEAFRDEGRRPPDPLRPSGGEMPRREGPHPDGPPHGNRPHDGPGHGPPHDGPPHGPPPHDGTPPPPPSDPSGPSSPSGP